MPILQIDSSVMGDSSVSRPLTAAVVAKILSVRSFETVVKRDLVDEPLSHYTAVLRIHGSDLKAGTPAQQTELRTGEAILSEFLAADTVVIGAPMYNFSIPSQLKAWVDLVCVAGKTFRYGPAGATGLCEGKRAIIVSTRGGKFGPGSPNAAMDFQENYLKVVLGFLWIDDIDIVRAEGVAYGPEARAAAVAAAEEQISALVIPAPP